MLTLFVRIENRAAQPILPLRLFADAERSGAYAARVLYLGAMVGFFFFTTLYLQEVAGFRPALTGLAFVPATMLHVPVAIVVPRLIRRFGRNAILLVGMVIGIVAMAWLSRAGVGSNYWTTVALPMVLIGVSQGLTLSPLTSSGVARVSTEDAGAASGAVNVAHQMGSSVGLSVLIAIAAVGSVGLTGTELTAYRASHAFDAGTVMLIFALVVAVTTMVPAASRQQSDAHEAESLAAESAA